jgi:hypothetical protein
MEAILIARPVAATKGITHDFSMPIPPGTLRISVIWKDRLHRIDLLMVKIPDTIKAFEEFIGIVLSAEDGRCTPEAAKTCTEVTVLGTWSVLPADSGHGSLRVCSQTGRVGRC